MKREMWREMWPFVRDVAAMLAAGLSIYWGTAYVVAYAGGAF